MRSFPLHLALLGFLVGLAGCPSDDGPRAPDDSANPGPADDGETSGKPEPAKPEPGDGDGDGDSAAESCEDARKRLEAELAACQGAK
jgi:hypothetical protein